jgi:hypothetical protein
MANWNQNIAQSTDGLCTLWRVSDNAQIQLHSVDAREWLDRAPGTYTEFLAPGQAPNPALSGVNKIVIGSRVSFRGPWDSRR